jgi:hypothetical protein
MLNTIYHIPDTFLDVCIALTSGIAALFIPLFYTVVIRLDEKYESRLIIRFFWAEKVVKRFLISTLVLLVLTVNYSLKFEPWFKTENVLIINSAAFLTGLSLVLTVVLGILSLIKMNKYQDPEKLFHLIKGSKSFTDKERRIVRFDLLFHSLKDLNYNKDFTKTICDELENEILGYKDKAENLPIEYFDALEQLTASVFNKNFYFDTRHNKRAVLILWNTLFFNRFPTNDLTYSLMWNHLFIAIENDWDILIQKHWERADSMIKMKDFNSTGSDQIDEINYTEEYLYFFIVLGSLLLNNKKTELLKNCIEYTSTWPPRYYLLPTESQKIIEYFKDFNDPYDSKNIWLLWKYYFPGSSGFDQDRRIKIRINQFLILLLMRSEMKSLKEISFNVEEYDKFECDKYIIALERLIKEISLLSDVDLINQVLDEKIDEVAINDLLTKIENLKNKFITYKRTMKSQEEIEKIKIERFCKKVKNELYGFIEELTKIKRRGYDNIPISFQYIGFQGTVDKDFFVANSNVDYLHFEESFASVFKQNIQNKIGYEINQRVILKLTCIGRQIADVIQSFGNSAIVLNFGLQILEELKNENIVNFGRASGVTPRAFIINIEKNQCFGIQFGEIKLDKDFEIEEVLMDKQLSIGIGRLNKGGLDKKFKDLINKDLEPENTVGIEIGTNISVYMPKSLKCVCLIEHQTYRDSKDPDSIDENELKQVLEII